MKKNIVGGVFLLALVSFFGWWILAGDGKQRIASMVAISPSDQSAKDIGNLAVNKSSPVATTGAALGEVRSTSSYRSVLYDSFVKSTDFQQTLRSLLAQKTNPEATYLATLLIWRCGNYWGPDLAAMHRKKIDVESGTNLGGSRASRIKALEAEIQRCQSMTREDLTALKSPYEAVKAAAAAGDPKAIAAQLVRDNTKSRDDDLAAAKTAEQLAALRDPVVIGNLAAYFDSRESSHRWQFEPFDQPISGKDLAIAWSLSACEFGSDCSSQSEQLVAGCIRFGHCDVADRSAYYERYLTTPEQFARILQLRNVVLTGLSTGLWPVEMWQGGQVKKRQ